MDSGNIRNYRVEQVDMEIEGIQELKLRRKYSDNILSLKFKLLIVCGLVATITYVYTRIK